MLKVFNNTKYGMIITHKTFVFFRMEYENVNPKYGSNNTKSPLISLRDSTTIVKACKMVSLYTDGDDANCNTNSNNYIFIRIICM